MNPYFLLAIVVAFVVSNIGMYVMGKSDGRTDERAAWMERELVQREAYAKKERELQDAYRKKEQESARDMAAVSAAYQRELNHANAAKDRALADLRAGRLRLRDPGARSQPPCGSGLPEAGAGAAGRDGEARGELSGATAEFLVALAGEADQVARQLAACQAVVIEDRK